MPDPSDPTIDVPADAQRFAQAVLPHVDAAYNLARWLSGDAQDADDIVQDACLRAFRLFGGFRGGDGRPWLLAIVRNTWFSECARRKQARTQPWQDDGTDPQAELPPDDEAIAYGADPAALLARADDVRRMQAALARLPLAYREVVVLRELEDLPYRDIAAIVDVPVGTVMSRLARGRQQLARLLMEDEAAPARTKVTPIRASGNAGNAGNTAHKEHHDEL
ncbi:RNA polymerase sigma factor [uncultured Ralstonia sp.]|jgi:RNA polymerase sigma-70 factor (ECF subfamily)|uniref:RNA polymerase sigma factor n=1 Tax=Ralstonia sp. TaxID=54061 RepID=UPI001EAC5D99|nr:RNA polymerase sigma factor [uncultured Ralstonia sp.]UCF26414.1 MAG: RNA polymerase sigma factor [Ralstonia sp.]